MRQSNRSAVLRVEGTPELVCPVGVRDGAPRHDSEAESVVARLVISIDIEDEGQLRGKGVSGVNANFTEEDAAVWCFAEFAMGDGVVNLATEGCGNLLQELQGCLVELPIGVCRGSPNESSDGVFRRFKIISLEDELSCLGNRW